MERGLHQGGTALSLASADLSLRVSLGTPWPVLRSALCSQSFKAVVDCAKRLCVHVDLRKHRVNDDIQEPYLTLIGPENDRQSIMSVFWTMVDLTASSGEIEDAWVQNLVIPSAWKSLAGQSMVDMFKPMLALDDLTQDPGFDDTYDFQDARERLVDLVEDLTDKRWEVLLRPHSKALRVRM